MPNVKTPGKQHNNHVSRYLKGWRLFLLFDFVDYRCELRRIIDADEFLPIVC